MKGRQEQEAGPSGISTGALGEQRAPEPLARKIVAALSVALPPIFFYAILIRKASNLPIFDDYDAVLGFLNGLTQLSGFSAKASYFLASQHGEFKLFFLHAMVSLQFYLFGHVDFRMLANLANGFVLMLAIVLWKMFLPTRKDLAARMVLFTPVSWLIFQLQYSESLDFATPGFQHLAVLAFSLGAIHLLVRGERWAFWSAAVMLVLAVSADGNGLLIIPIGALILTLGRRYARAAAWLAVSAACVAAYAYRYNTMQSATHAHQSIFSVALRFRPDYVIAFIGGAASFPFQLKAGSLSLGILLCIFFAYMAWRGYIRKNPAVSYSVLFLLITAIGVAGLRSDFGVANLPSRYTIYSVLFVAFAWFAVVEEFLHDRRGSYLDSGVFLAAVAVTALFSLSMDLIGFNLIGERNGELVQAMTQFEHPAAAASEPSPSPPLGALLTGRAPNLWEAHARSVLIESMRLGVYRPPQL